KERLLPADYCSFAFYAGSKGNSNRCESTSNFQKLRQTAHSRWRPRTSKSPSTIRTIQIGGPVAAIKLKEDMAETLLNSPNPLRLFAASWHLAVEAPRRAARQKIHEELLNRDLRIVTALMLKRCAQRALAVGNNHLMNVRHTLTVVY